MEFVFVRKTEASLTGDSPTLLKVTSSEGGYAVVGRRMSRKDRKKLRRYIGRGEYPVWVNADVVDGPGNTTEP